MRRELLDPCCDVDVVAVEPPFMRDHVAGVDAGSEGHPAVCGRGLVERRDPLLEIERRQKRFGWIAELRHNRIAGVAEGSPTMRAAALDDDVAPLFEGRQGRLVVHSHQARETSRVDRNDRRELSDVPPSSHAAGLPFLPAQVARPVDPTMFACLSAATRPAMRRPLVRLTLAGR